MYQCDVNITGNYYSRQRLLATDADALEQLQTHHGPVYVDRGSCETCLTDWQVHLEWNVCPGKDGVQSSRHIIKWDHAGRHPTGNGTH